jgi:hypothetical protein
VPVHSVPGSRGKAQKKKRRGLKNYVIPIGCGMSEKSSGTILGAWLSFFEKQRKIMVNSPDGAGDMPDSLKMRIFLCPC